MSETTSKRKYVRHGNLVAAIDMYHAEHPYRGSHRASEPKKRKDEVRHPVFSRTVIVEERNGGGVTVRTIERSKAFRKMRGKYHLGRCESSAYQHCMDSFYGQIDRDIREWDFLRDLILRVPYAVKRFRRERGYQRRRWQLLRKWAIREGLV